MAGSPNAFARIFTGAVSLPNGNGEHQEDSRAPKRARSSEEGVAAIYTQCAQSDTSLEVNHMILDYVAFHTISACLSSRGGNTSDISLPSNLAMCESMLSVLKSQRPSYQPDPELRLRLSLLRCVTLFSQRLTSNPTTPAPTALVALRQTNQERARAWISESGLLPSSADDTTLLDERRISSQTELDRNRAHVLHELGVPAEDEGDGAAFYGTSSCLSLLDILPPFTQVSAISNTMYASNLTDRWMQLACEFMLQACLEQYLVFGANGSDAIDEAFAWGYLEKGADGMDVDVGQDVVTGNSDEVNDMFEDEDYAVEVEGWAEIKKVFLNELINAIAPDDSPNGDGANAASRLQRLAGEHPIQRFETSIVKFLEALSNSIPKPVLVQLERGRLDGMTNQQTQQFLTECGVGVARFFDQPAGFKAAVR